MRQAPYLQLGCYLRHVHHLMLTVPNVITLMRLALVPLIAYLLLRQLYGLAALVFLAAAISDLVDGVIARRFNQTSELGALLDPIADKLNMVTTTVVLAWQALVPLWLAVLVVLRDVVIVVGAIAYRVTIGRIEIAPSLLSKINTAVEFGVLLLVMAHAAEWVDATALLPVLFGLVLVTVVGSGVHYVWRWSWKASRDSRRGANG